VPAILVSSNELPRVIDELTKAGFDVYEANLPFDFLLYTNSGPIARERKAFPSDFLASVQDGRFSRECAAMREASKFPGLIFEVQSRTRNLYTSDGHLRNGRKETNWTKAGVRNLCRSLRYVEGCDIERTVGVAGTADSLLETYHYFDSTSHLSLRQRPRIVTDWIVPTFEERYIHWLQGLPAVSIRRARILSVRFPNPKSMHAASFDDIRACPSIGTVIATGIYGFLHGE